MRSLSKQRSIGDGGIESGGIGGLGGSTLPAAAFTANFSLEVFPDGGE